jgi:hypothetical protein
VRLHWTLDHPPPSPPPPLSRRRSGSIFGIAAGIPFYIGMAVMSIDGRPWQAYAPPRPGALCTSPVGPAPASGQAS